MTYPVPPNNLVRVLDADPEARRRLQDKAKVLDRAQRDDRMNVWKSPEDGGPPEE